MALPRRQSQPLTDRERALLDALIEIIVADVAQKLDAKASAERKTR